jgi:hypothetical protein
MAEPSSCARVTYECKVQQCCISGHKEKGLVGDLGPGGIPGPKEGLLGLTQELQLRAEKRAEEKSRRGSVRLSPCYWEEMVPSEMVGGDCMPCRHPWPGIFGGDCMPCRHPWPGIVHEEDIKLRCLGFLD